MKTKSQNNNFALLLQNYFYQRLIEQGNYTRDTVSTYRYTFKLLLEYLRDKHKISPDAVALKDLNSKNILGFLKYLEQDRHNGTNSRNNRLAAIRSFLKYAVYQVPTSLPMVQKVLAIPMKRFQKTLPKYLNREQMQAIMDAPDASTWSGKRDRVLLATLYNTGARVSEVAALKQSDVDIDKSISVSLTGKGRKQRVVPLWKSTTKQIKSWLKYLKTESDSPLFPSVSGNFMTRSGIEKRLKRAVEKASESNPELKKKTITPHVIRHSTAMALLQSGVDITVIALWLGHESIATTHMYVEADLAMKENALSKIQEPTQKAKRYKAPDKLLQFLRELDLC